jgi:hypothetical protein
VVALAVEHARRLQDVHLIGGPGDGNGGEKGEKAAAAAKGGDQPRQAAAGSSARVSPMHGTILTFLRLLNWMQIVQH